MRRSWAVKACASLCVFTMAKSAFAQQVCTDDRKPASLRGAEGLMAPSKILYKGEPQISADLIANYEEIRKTEKPVDVTAYIPTNMEPTDDSSRVMNVIADKSASQIFNSPSFRASSLGKTATQVEKTMKQEVVLGSAQPNEIQHKFNFQVQAFQTRAEVKYEGVTNATVSYQARNSTTTLEIFEKLPTTLKQQVVLSHEISPEQRLSNLSVRWNW